jgi:triphosphatase
MDAIRPTKATSIELLNGMRTGEAFERILGACLRHAALNAELISQDEPEAVHQARVGFRRARSAIALFKPHLHEKSRKTMYRELRAIGKHLAPLRDWDVFCHETLPRLVHRFPELSGVVQAAEDKRVAAYATLERGRVIEATRNHISLEMPDPIATIAPDLLDNQYFIVRRAFRHIDTAERRHTLRKAMKKLRYSIEFLADLFEPKPMNAFHHHCKDIQDVLGRMNDAETMSDMLTELWDQDPQSIIMTSLEWAKHKQDKATGDLAGTRAEFRAAKPFWD